MSCATAYEQAESRAQQAGLRSELIAGKGYQHRVYEHKPAEATGGDLHIYIGGDGTPWLQGRYPAEDPTPKYATALELIISDKGPAIFVARPCYYGTRHQDPACHPRLWTSARYSGEVVASTLAVIQRYQQLYNPTRLILIGFSGGGAIATLLAPQLDGDVYLVTLAGNLDITAWTELHGYLPLTESLNPADFKLQTADLPQLHLMGGLDEEVPASIIQDYSRGLSPASLREYSGIDHNCCWLEVWQEVLAERPWSYASANP